MIEYYLNNVVVKELWYPLTFTMFTYDKMKPNLVKIPQDQTWITLTSVYL